jgi:hypothetical protein
MKCEFSIQKAIDDKINKSKELSVKKDRVVNMIKANIEKMLAPAPKANMGAVTNDLINSVKKDVK